MESFTKPITDWIENNVPISIAIGVFIFLIFFEVSKIKIYPLRWLWKCISWPFRKIDEQRTHSFKSIVASMKSDLDDKLTEIQSETNKNYELLKDRFDSFESRLNELDGRFDSLDIRQDQTDERLDELAAARIKNHVLNFARQCRKDESHSHEDFANLFKENKIYERLVEKYGWENDVYKHDFEYIKRVYDATNDNGGFLE